MVKTIDRARSEEFKIQAALAGRELQESADSYQPVSKAAEDHGKKVAERFAKKQKEILKGK